MNLFFPLYSENIEVYDGDANFRKRTPRSIRVPKHASYAQILVRHQMRVERRCSLLFDLFQEAALRTFHINDDCTKYCITVPTDDGKKTDDSPWVIEQSFLSSLVGGDQSVDEAMPLKSLKQLSVRPLRIYIRYRERADIDVDYVRVYPGILQ